jgi:prevent-host-death family protein
MLHPVAVRIPGHSPAPKRASSRSSTAPQTLTRNGKPCAVIVSADEWARKTDRRGSLAEFLLASPLRGAEIDLERQHDVPRDTEL